MSGQRASGAQSVATLVGAVERPRSAAEVCEIAENWPLTSRRNRSGSYLNAEPERRSAVPFANELDTAADALRHIAGQVDFLRQQSAVPAHVKKASDLLVSMAPYIADALEQLGEALHGS